MAVNNLGYRSWNGPLRPDLVRWFVITSTGVTRAWQSMWLRRLLLAVWIPAIWFGAGFFAWEQFTSNPELVDRRGPARALIRATISREASEMIDWRNPENSRSDAWAWMLYGFMRYPQIIILVLVVGMIAPPLISQDIRSRAFLLYFSRPLNRAEYLLGKLTTIWWYLALISIIPGLSLYILGIFLSPNFDVFTSTWDLPLRVVAASVTMMLPTATLAASLSSLTQESRYASFSWFAIWVLGWFTYGVMSGVEGFNQGPGTISTATSSWTLVSMYHLLDGVQRWIFGIGTFDANVRNSLIVLAAITIISTTILMRRIAAPMKA